MKKKIIAAALAVCMMATLAVGMTLAYFTDTKTAVNTFTVGNVKIDLAEKKWETSGKEEGKSVYAGEALAKDPTVTNTGANPCFVRIKVDGLDSLVPQGTQGTERDKWMITYRTEYANKLGEGWVDGKDGYYYYTKVLENKDEATTPLFDQIVMPTALKGDDQNPAYNVVVKAEAVQAQGAMPKFDDVKTMTVAQIAQWFARTMNP
jgi:predicted ribosomally synthesized peptide with SipW-like signal peptide